MPDPEPTPEPVIQPFSWNPSVAPSRSSDLERIAALPRRPAKALPEYVDEMTARLRRPNGTMSLRPVQAWALAEAERVGAICGMVQVGGGKTGLSLLLFTILGARRGVYIVPPQLKPQLVEHDHPQWSRHFRVLNLADGRFFQPDMESEGLIHVVTYSELSSVKGADVLERIRPDVIVADEFHLLRNFTAARTKRFRRYLRAALKSGDLRSLNPLSGTLGSRTVMDYSILEQVLGEGAPFPHHYPVQAQWAEALDPGDWRAPPGELVRLCESPLEDVRSAFRRRLTETPGIITSPPDTLGVGLEIHQVETKCPPAVEAELKSFRETWCINDDEVVDALTFYRKARELACGLSLYWDWTGVSKDLKEEWLGRRSEHFRWMRNFLAERAAPGLDSPLLVSRALDDGRVSTPTYEPWLEIKDQCDPETKARWVDQWLVDECAAWAEKPGIIFYSHIEFGRTLAKRANLPIYESADQAGDIIVESGKRAVVASVNAMGTGLNLQMFHRILFACTPSSVITLEQAIGRAHRPGQLADTVFVHVFRHTPELRKALVTARRDAQFGFETKGTPNKLLDATWTFDPEQ